MTAPSDGPRVRTLLRALAGHGDAGGEALPPVPWSTKGSVAARVLGGLNSSFRSMFRVLGPLLDSASSILLHRSTRWLLLVPAAWALVRLVFGGGAAGSIGALLLGVAGLSVILRISRALHPAEEGRVVARFLLAGVILRLLLGGAVHVWGGFPDEYGYYHPLAADTAACWARGGVSLLAEHPVVQGRGTYYLLLSSAYLLFGGSMIVGRVLGGLLGLLVAVLAGEVARPAGGRRAALFAVAVIALHPEHAIWSTTLSRDSLHAVLVLAGLAVLVRNSGRVLPRGGLLAVPAVFLLLHGFFLAAVALGATVLVLCTVEAMVPGKAAVGRLLRPPFAIAGVLLGGWFLIRNYGPWFRWDLITAVRRGADMSRIADGNPAMNDFLPGVVLDGPLSALAFLPAGVAFVLFAPWPWDAVHPARLLYALLQVAGTAATLLGLVGSWFAFRRWPARFAAPVLFVLFFLVELAFLEGASGIVARHRLPLTAVLASGAGILLAGLGARERSE